MRRLRWLALILGLVVSACGGSTSIPGTIAIPPPTCAQVYTLLRLTPSQIQQEDSAGRCVRPNLAVSGELQGRVRAAHINQPCSKLARGDGLPSNFYDF